MDNINSLKDNLNKVNAENFDTIALQLFKIQARDNFVYKSFVQQLGIDAETITGIDQIPFLPISFFKSHIVKTGEWEATATFTSSGTSGATTSSHFVKDLGFYLTHSERIFSTVLGRLDQYHFLALLPSYLERNGSSLIAMVDFFIKQSKSQHSGFYLNNHLELVAKINLLKKDERKIILLGVSFALLELAENYPLDLSNCIVMETGGMKGRRKEIIREELHEFLCSRFNVGRIASEYGMTELFSQAYSLQNGYYQCPESMKILIRDVYDPQELKSTGGIGLIKVIDLANFDSCAFIETQDLGRLRENRVFEVLGRLDNSDSRGCNLLM